MTKTTATRRPHALTFAVDQPVARPAAAAWAVVADYGRDPEWRQGVRTMAPSPAGAVGVGTTTAEVLRTGGRTLRNGGVVTDVAAGHHFAWRTTSGVDADGSRTVTATGPRTCTVRLELRVRPHGFDRLLAPVLRRVVARGLAADARRLATLVEGAAAGSARAAA
jgi:hypothetical protein